MNKLNDKLNINTIFCEEYDESTDSYTRLFDSIKLGSDNSIKKFNVVHFVSLMGIEKHRIVSILAKIEGERITSVIDLFDFYIPPQNEDGKTSIPIKFEENKINKKTIIREINFTDLKGPGEYALFVFTQPMEGKKESKDIQLQEMEVKTKSMLTVLE